MGNQFHLVVETPTVKLVDDMKWFLGTFTAGFNRRHNLFGHLFSGRCNALWYYVWSLYAEYLKPTTRRWPGLRSGYKWASGRTCRICRVKGEDLSMDRRAGF